MRPVIFFYLFLIVSLPAFTQETQAQHIEAPRETEASLASRFRIIQSDLAARLTFRLDRYSGVVSQLVKDTDGNSLWQVMDVSPALAIKTADHPRFQIFMSGLAVRFTFLLDNDSGRTWQLVKATTKNADGTSSDNESWQLVP